MYIIEFSVERGYVPNVTYKLQEIMIAFQYKKRKCHLLVLE